MELRYTPWLNELQFLPRGVQFREMGIGTGDP